MKETKKTCDSCANYDESRNSQPCCSCSQASKWVAGIIHNTEGVKTMNKERCAFDRGEDCGALKDKVCLGCSFFKTQEELDEGRDKAAIKVSQLEPKLRNHIRNKYYGGRRIYNGR